MTAFGLAVRWVHLACGLGLVGLVTALLLAGRSDRPTALAWEARMLRCARGLAGLLLVSGLAALAYQTAVVDRPRERRARSGGVGAPSRPEPVRHRLAGPPRPAPPAGGAPAAARARAVLRRPARLPRRGVAARRGGRGRHGVGRPRGRGRAAGARRRAPRRAPPDRRRGVVRRAPAAGRAAPGRVAASRARTRGPSRCSRCARFSRVALAPDAAHRRDGRWPTPGSRWAASPRWSARATAGCCSPRSRC